MSALPVSAEVVIAGGGPAGAATAWALARNGVDVVIVDRARFPRPKPCAEYLNPRALRVVAEMGVLESLERQGAARVDGMRVRCADGTDFEGQFTAHSAYPGYRNHGLAVRREILDTTLLESARAAGAKVVEGAAVQDLLRDARGAACGVAVRVDGRQAEIRARHVVGADGIRSVIARRLGLAGRSRWPTRYAFVTHVEGAVAGPPDRGEMHVFDDGYCGFAPLAGEQTNVAIVVPASGARLAVGDADGFFDDWTQAHGTVAARLRGARRVGPVMVTGPFASRSRRAWSRGATLVGDAADFFDPFTGEGICAALRGAELLAPYVVESLRAGAGREHEALEAYERCRRDEFRAKWRLERLVGLAVGFPRLLDAIGARLQGDRELGDLLIGATGGIVPARDVLSFRFAARLFGLTAPAQAGA
jgi:2-polyprenyl-6-methoxyphenol hydroxylase-like FAD-dependent oxidoreductase